MSAPGWEYVPLGPRCKKIGSGATPRGGESVYVENGTALIRSQNVYNSQFKEAGLAHITDKHAEQLAGVTVEDEDILLNITGDSVARSCQVPDAVLPARVNQHVAIIRPRKEDFDPRFLSYYLVSPHMQSLMLSLAGAGGTRKALTKDMIEQFQVPQPPRAAQTRIASLLASYDDLIENNRKRVTLLEEAARLLYREWFVQLRFPGHEHVKVIDGVPNGWERLPASEAFYINPTTPRTDEGEITYVPMAALSEVGMQIDKASFELRKESTSVRFQADDTLFARITPCLENGKTGYVQFLPPGEVACGSTEFVVLRGRRVSSYFVYLTARQTDFRENAIKSMIGSSGRQRVQPSCFDRYNVLVPPNHLAALFDETAASLFQQVRILNQQCERLAEARDILLPRLMSGEIAV